MSATTAFAKLAQAVAAALLAAPALAAGNVKTNPAHPWPADAAAAVNIILRTAEPAAGVSCGVEWRVSILVRCHARVNDAAAMADPLVAVDGLLSAVAGRIAAADFAAFGVTTPAALGPIEWDIDPGDKTIATATIGVVFTIFSTDALLVAI